MCPNLNQRCYLLQTWEITQKKKLNKPHIWWSYFKNHTQIYQIEPLQISTQINPNTQNRKKTQTPKLIYQINNPQISSQHKHTHKIKTS